MMSIASKRCIKTLSDFTIYQKQIERFLLQLATYMSVKNQLVERSYRLNEVMGIALSIKILL